MIGIVASHAVELRPLVQQLQDRRNDRGVAYGRLRGVSVALVSTGQGWERSAVATTRLMHRTRCTGVVVTGFAGATQPGFGVGDVVIPQEIVDMHRDGERLDGPRYRPPLPLEVLRERLAGCGGVLGTVGGIVADPRDKEQLGRRARVVAVDLESAAAVSAAHGHGVPWVVTRIVLDPMERPLGVVSRCHAVVLAVSVRGWGRLRRFRDDLVMAQRRLGESVGVVVEEMNRLLDNRDVHG